jgi:hypothetical protein
MFLKQKQFGNGDEMPRIAPVTPPYDDEVGAQLARMMPPGVPPIALFRTFAVNLPMATAMSEWGSYELSKALSLSLRDREILIDRTCARCNCEYEFGVHVAFFAERAGLGSGQVASLVDGGADDDCWPAGRDRLLIRLADAFHDDAAVPEDLWEELRTVFEPGQLLDASLLCGWYHAIAFAANLAQVDPEPGAPIFADVRAAGSDGLQG